jgi:hypothetical protein
VNRSKIKAVGISQRDELQSLARTLGTPNPRNDEEIGHVSIAVGAINALIKAIDLKYSDKKGITSWKNARGRAGDREG